MLSLLDGSAAYGEWPLVKGGSPSADFHESPLSAPVRR